MISDSQWHSSDEKWFCSADDQGATCLPNCTLPFLFVLFLTDPVFVGSAYIEESQPIGNPVGDDDKIYFFFSEAGKEFDFFDNTIVSRIARVCKVRCRTGMQTRTIKEVSTGPSFLLMILDNVRTIT